MRKQKGFTMPGTIIFLILLTFFIYETNMLFTDKNFYIGIEQKFLLDELLNRSITDIKKTYSKKKKKVRFSFSMKREKRVEIMSLKMI